MKKVIGIVGPTGVGKTKTSIQIAKTFHGEIISGDSMQVYKEMSIGTAKVTKAEAGDVPHFLVDELHYNEEYNVKIFQEKARNYIDEIIQRNHVPMIVGGTGLYVKSCIYDYEFVDQEEDQDFINFLKQRSNDELWAMLSIVDPQARANIHKNNRQRVVRALCMAHEGKKKSEIIQAQQHQPIYDAYLIGLTMSREQLYARIDQRVDQMMEQGLFEEIEALVKNDENIWQLQSFQGIGYKEWKPYFVGSASKEACVEAIKKNSRNFAKRQYTWFKNQLNVHWYNIEEAGYQARILKDVEEWLHNGN